MEERPSPIQALSWFRSDWMVTASGLQSVILIDRSKVLYLMWDYFRPELECCALDCDLLAVPLGLGTFDLRRFRNALHQWELVVDTCSARR